jgi:hypothetical protein
MNDNLKPKKTTTSVLKYKTIDFFSSVWLFSFSTNILTNQ